MITTSTACAAHTSRAHPVIIVSTIYMVAAG
jgi:hypothetical protein